MSGTSSGPAGERMPRLLRHLAFNLVIGVAFGVAFTAMLVAGNVGDLGDLIERSSQPWLAKFMLCAMNVLTFGSLAMGASIMSLPWDRRPPDEGS